MAKEYAKRHSAPRRAGASKQLLLVVVSFLLGYLSASVFDFNSVKNWVNTQLLSEQMGKVAMNTPPKPVELPKPKFEFYTLLANDNSNPTNQAKPSTPTASTATAEAKSPPKPATVTTATATAPNPTTPLPIVVSAKPVPMPSAKSKEAYLVQVAAFKSMQEAARMKAALVLKGFTVNITPGGEQKNAWYRVSIGPFASRTDALKAQGDVARTEHIVGMIRKMDG